MTGRVPAGAAPDGVWKAILCGVSADPVVEYGTAARRPAAPRVSWRRSPSTDRHRQHTGNRLPLPHPSAVPDDAI